MLKLTRPLVPAPEAGHLDDVLAQVCERRGIDFRQYRPGTVERRVERRMRLVGAKTYRDYLDRLVEDEQEADRLVECVTIKVSRFFRDMAVFDRLGRVALPDLLERVEDRPLRLWSAGCGRGEEAYSLAILLEQTGALRQRPDSAVWATDVDPQALASARAARYPAEALAELPPNVRAAFFRELGTTGARYAVRAALRQRVRLLRHDLTSEAEAPAGLQFDLICCRNVLIYFGRRAQERAQRLLVRSLTPGGYLCLGEAEYLLPTVEPALEVVDGKARLFRRNGAEWRGRKPE